MFLLLFEKIEKGHIYSQVKKNRDEMKVFPLALLFFCLPVSPLTSFFHIPVLHNPHNLPVALFLGVQVRSDYEQLRQSFAVVSQQRQRGHNVDTTWTTWDGF